MTEGSETPFLAILSFKFCHVKSTNAIVTRGKGGRAASKAATKPQSGRQSGILNYQTVKLLEVIESIKLFGGQMWERVARRGCTKELEG